MLGEEKTYTISYNKIKEDDLDSIGINAVFLSRVINAGINLPPGFIITSNAFDNFLIANDLVDEIREIINSIKNSKFENIQKASVKIGTLISKAIIPPSIMDTIRNSYNQMQGLHNCVLELKPSWLGELQKHNGNIDKKYSFTGISDLEDLEARIKMTWLALFDPKGIFERLENNYDGPLTIAVLVQKMPNSEISGRAFSYNPINHRKDEVEIETVLGLYKGVDELGLIPDSYIVSKENERIVEKNTVTQEKMLIRKGFIKKGESQEMSIKISKPWQVRQKLHDNKIQDLTKLLKTIEELAEKIVEVKWGIEIGKIYITEMLFKTSTNDHNQKINKIEKSFNPELEILPAKSNSEEQERSIDQYVQEIEHEIENLENSADDMINNNPSDIANQIPTYPVSGSIELVEEEEESYTPQKNIEKKELGPKVNNLWDKYEFSKISDINSIATQIWLDMNVAPSKREINSNEFYGLYGINGEDLLEGYGRDISDFSKSQLQELENYIVEEIFSLINQDLSRHAIYSISMLDQAKSEKFFYKSKSTGLKVHDTDDRLINAELSAIKTLRGKRGFRNCWLGIRGINQIDDLQKIKKIISANGLRRSSMFKIFLEVDKLPLFLNIQEYLKENVDGIILYIDVIFKELLGTKISIKDLLENEVFWDMMYKLALQIHKYDINFVVKSEVLHTSEELITELLKVGINGISLGADNISDVRKKLTKLELNVLAEIKKNKSRKKKL